VHKISVFLGPKVVSLLTKNEFSKEDLPCYIGTERIRSIFLTVFVPFSYVWER
jgi:hypothetical protein